MDMNGRGLRRPLGEFPENQRYVWGTGEDIFAADEFCKPGDLQQASHLIVTVDCQTSAHVIHLFDLLGSVDKRCCNIFEKRPGTTEAETYSVQSTYTAQVATLQSS